MRIAVDVDGVLADEMTQLLRYHNDRYGTSFTNNNITSYDTWKIWGGTKEDDIKKVFDFYKTPYFEEIRPIKGSREGAEKLGRNNELVIITSRPTIIAHETVMWLSKYFPKQFTGIYFTNRYSLTGQKTRKRDFCTQLDVDLVIEDSLNNALSCVAERRKIFLFNQPWNQHQTHELHPTISRVYSWEQIVETVEE